MNHSHAKNTQHNAASPVAPHSPSAPSFPSKQPPPAPVAVPAWLAAEALNPVVAQPQQSLLWRHWS